MTQAGKTRRNTAQKDAVRRALASAEGFVSAQDLHRRLDGEGSRVALATVYRQLNALADEGEADIVSTGDEQLFRTCRQPDRHHHHLICENCGNVVEVTPDDEGWFARIAADHGYTVTRHSIEIYGRCPRCQNG
ncbi:MAG: Fur family transcriptional regulator [Brevibacterium aurantiacum]|uniref:Fur family transcriptional regulator, ferric uptake regulator n=1 Tax=Brevibacterium aurantiacum TaxID=273384 RepID=A0A2H1IZF3_BREAU|nr:transcriptional repressor [Brevibacterium aurantiacum]SMX80546.1 Fur family transcriptional regulator, ferric uptake regulator [Brevibacterium aurantiacum]